MSPDSTGVGAKPPPSLPERPRADARLTMRSVLDVPGMRGILGAMLTHPTFLFTYGDRPAGCHGRAA
ncbi:hypothetical protein GCM10010398_41340 [Streptomyces fimbriatus]